MKKIVVLSTQRSGSTMVCDDLAGTNCLGRPSEYFIKVLEDLDVTSPANLSNMINEIEVRGSTENQVSAVKIMSSQVQGVGRSILKAGITNEKGPDLAFKKYFGDAVFLRIIRKDKVAQAVSRVIAKQTDIYHLSDNPSGLEGMMGKLKNNRDEAGLQYDKEEIASEIEKIVFEEKHLDNFIKKLGFNVKEIVYEDVISDRSYVNSIADSLGLNTVMLSPRRLKKVAGSVSKDWIEKFKK